MPRALLYVLAALLFLGASLLSPAPTVLPNDVPDARDVGAARGFARQFIWVIRQDGPAPLIVRTRDLEGLARVAAYSDPALSVSAEASEEDVRVAASYQLADRTWINAGATADVTESDEQVGISAGIGALQLGDMATRFLVDRVVAVSWADESEPPHTADILRTVRRGRSHVSLVLDVPPPLLRGLQRLGGRYSEEAVAAADETFARLDKTFPPRAEPYELAELIAAAFPPGPAVSSEAAGGRIVGIMMAAFSPNFRRLVDTADATGITLERQPRDVRMAGRRDLALHFMFSAAIASRGGMSISNALGEYKELSDSLPGGSGFSFVDLAADRAGTRLGERLSDADGTDATQRRLSAISPGDLFPAAALGMTEGLTEAEFEARFGRLDSSQYIAAVARIDAALAVMPAYAAD